jgi:hypothetical protein
MATAELNQATVKQITKVQMDLDKRTMDSIEHLKELTGINNRTRLVVSSIQLTELITEIMVKKGKVILEHQDGSKETLKFLI